MRRSRLIQLRSCKGKVSRLGIPRYFAKVKYSYSDDNENYLPEQHPALRPIKIARSINLPDALNQQFTSEQEASYAGCLD